MTERGIRIERGSEDNDIGVWDVKSRVMKVLAKGCCWALFASSQ